MRTRTVVGVVAAVAAAGVVTAVAVPVVRGSDAANTEIRVATDNPLPPEVGPLPASVRQLWTAPTATAGPSVEGPSAIVTSDDRVAGLDPATGRERWSYRRTNARLCDASLRDGVVVALFAKSHGCRDLIGLDAGTGARRWYRTVELTTDATLTSGTGVVVATAGAQLIAVDSGGGLNRWTWTADAGCTLDPAVVGGAAVATVARCADGPARLVVHPPYENKAPWLGSQPAGADPHVLSADGRVVVLAGDTLTTYGIAQAGGKLTATPAGSVRDPRLAVAGTPAAVPEGDFVVVWTGRTALGVDTRTRAVRWAAAASGPPTLAEGQVLLAGAGGFTNRPLATGTPVTEVAASAVPRGAALSRIGRLVVAAGNGRLVAYG